MFKTILKNQDLCCANNGSLLQVIVKMQSALIAKWFWLRESDLGVKIIPEVFTVIFCLIFSSLETMSNTTELQIQSLQFSWNNFP